MMQDINRELEHDIQVRIKAAQQQFDYAFTTLCFAALALSLQFSERPESIWRGILVISWILYLIAALLAGWRIMHVPQIDKINFSKIILKNFIRQRQADLKNPYFINAVNIVAAEDINTGEPLRLDELRAGLAGEKEKLEFAKKNIKSLQLKMICCFNISVGLFIAALFFNGLYISVNFLK